MAVTPMLAPLAVQRFVDNNGNALAGGKVFTYAAGTTTKQTSYTDSTAGTPNANPIILNSRGECNLWLDQTKSYKLVLSPSTDTDPPTNAIWTVDNIRLAPAYYLLSTIAALRLLLGTSGMAVLVEGYYAAGDGGGGNYYWNSSSSAADNGGTIINPTGNAGSGRWILLTYGQPYSVLQFGCKGDGVTNDTTAFQAALTACPAGAKVIVPVLAFLLDPITVPTDVILAGSSTGPFDGTANPVSSVCAPTLAVNTSASTFLTLNAGAGLQDILFFYPNQVSPTAATPTVFLYTVTALSNNVIQRCTFANSYNGISATGGRTIIRDIKMGAYNIGILLDGFGDWVVVDDIMNQVFWDSYAGLTFPQTIDTWVQAHSVAMVIGRADSALVNNFVCYSRYTGIQIIDGSLGGGIINSYGRMTNIDLDTVSYGVYCTSTAQPGWDILNMTVGLYAASVTPQASLYLPAGGSAAPAVRWSHGSVRGTPAIGPTVNGAPCGVQVSAGTARVNEVGSLNYVGLLTAPGVPGSTVSLVNPFPFDVQVSVLGGTVSAVALGGQATGQIAGFFPLGSGQAIKLTYTVAPTWAWFGL